MDVRVGKYCFNSDSPDLANKEAFNKAFPNIKPDPKKGVVGFDSNTYWKLYERKRKETENAGNKEANK